MRTAAGFSLVELMVAITLSLLLLTGVVAIFSSSRVSYESTHQLSRIQETGRFALEQLSRHIRSAGFAGCARQPNFVSTALSDQTALQWDFLGGAVRGYEASGSSFTPSLENTGVEDDAAPGSDVLVLRGPRLDAEPTAVTTAMLDPQNDLAVASTAGIRSEGEVVMAYSCEAQAFFFALPSGNSLRHGVGGRDPGPKNASATTSYPFRVDDEVVPVETVVYYVGTSENAKGDNATLPADTNSLWRRAGLQPAEELVEGVEQMQVEYGLDSDGDRLVDGYAAAAADTNWDRVIAIRVALLVRSLDEKGTDRDGRRYQLLKTVVNPPGDRRLREVFSATVSIRNRVRVD